MKQPTSYKVGIYYQNKAFSLKSISPMLPAILALEDNIITLRSAGKVLLRTKIANAVFKPRRRLGKVNIVIGDGTVSYVLDFAPGPLTPSLTSRERQEIDEYRRQVPFESKVLSAGTIGLASVATSSVAGSLAGLVAAKMLIVEGNYNNKLMAEMASQLRSYGANIPEFKASDLKLSNIMMEIMGSLGIFIILFTVLAAALTFRSDQTHLESIILTIAFVGGFVTAAAVSIHRINTKY